MKRSLLVLPLVPALVLAGCAAAPTASVDDPRPVVIVERGRPSTAPSSGFDPSASWASGGTRLELITFGSSTCPDVPLSVEAVASGGFTLRMREYDGMCTQDLAPYRVVLERPAGVDPGRARTVRLVHARGRDDVVRVPPTGG